MSAGGAVDEPPATTSEKSAFFFSPSLVLVEDVVEQAHRVPHGISMGSGVRTNRSDRFSGDLEHAHSTRTVAVPNFPSHVAVITTVPRSDANHDAGRIDRGDARVLPLAQVTDAIRQHIPGRIGYACSERRGLAYLDRRRSTEMITTFDTGTRRTVTEALPAMPSITAVITAVPGTSPVTRPVCEIDATAALFVVQTTVRPGIDAPLLSYGVATRFVARRDEEIHVVGDDADCRHARRHGKNVDRRDRRFAFDRRHNVDASRIQAGDDTVFGDARNVGIPARPNDPAISHARFPPRR